jgi:hypothetical protein
LFFERHGSLVGLILFAETGDIPDSDSQIHRGGNYEVVPRVELRAPAK